MCSDELFFHNERPELFQDALLAFGVKVRMHFIGRAADLHFKRIFSAEINRRDVQCWLIHAVTPLPRTTISVTLLSQQIKTGDDVVFNLFVGIIWWEVLLQPVTPQTDLLPLIGLLLRHD